jgi:transcriptional regulator with XRE-family HTH domain
MDLYLSGMPFKPSKLEQWQIEDAHRLKRLYVVHCPKGMSQELFGERFGIGNQAAVWQYLNAKRPLNIKAAAAFARGLGLAIADISPKLAAQLDAMNANPRLRELLEECADLSEDQIKALKTMAAAFRDHPSTKHK